VEARGEGEAEATGDISPPSAESIA